jgi:excisionase family DNA binding protein
MTDGRCASPIPASAPSTSKPPHQEVFDVATRVTIKGGTDRPTPKFNETLPFREGLGCSPSEACAALGVGRTFLYRLIAERRIEVRKLGRRTIISVPSLLKLLDAEAAEPKPRRRGRPRKTDAVVAS